MESFISGNNISYLLVLGAFGILPLVFMACTSFLKISIVLSVLRNALGGGQVPSQAISGVLALVLTLYTMAPVFEKSIQKSLELESLKTNSSFSSILAKFNSLSSPILDFMRENTPLKERAYFLELQAKRKKVGDSSYVNEICSTNNTQNYKDCIDNAEGIPSLLLSFVASEIRIACTIGVFLFLPFLAVDLIVSTILTALGMMMVSPVTISLPLKLLLFVMSDGWRLLMENLILSYKVI
jgi:type III secretory pathway component EscR